MNPVKRCNMDHIYSAVGYSLPLLYYSYIAWVAPVSHCVSVTFLIAVGSLPLATNVSDFFATNVSVVSCLVYKRMSTGMVYRVIYYH